MPKLDNGGKQRPIVLSLITQRYTTKRQRLVNLWKSGFRSIIHTPASEESLIEKLQRKLWPNTIIETLIMILVLILVLKLCYGLISSVIFQSAL